MFVYKPSTTDETAAKYWENHPQDVRCYNYASLFGLSFVEPGTRFFTQPNYNISISPFNLRTIKGLHRALLFDGWRHAPHTNEHTIPTPQPDEFLVAAITDFVHGYHFFRQDSDGLWSHKSGQYHVTRADPNGHTILNPIRHKSFYHFVGFYAAPKSGLWRQHRTDLLALPAPREQQELHVPVPALNR